MNLDTVRIYCNVAKTRSFSLGAKKSGIAQSTASQAVAQLEKRLGAQLLDRSTRPLTLTDQGLMYFEECVELLEQFDALKERMESRGRQSEEIISVAAMYLFMNHNYSMDDIITELIREIPGAQVEFHFLLNSREIHESVAEGESDLGLTVFGETTREVIALPWRQEPMAVICSTKHPLAKKSNPTLQDLNGLECIGWPEASRHQRMIIDYLSSRGVRPSQTTEIDRGDFIKQAVASSRAFAIVPKPSVEREVAAGSLTVVPIPDMNLTRPHSILKARKRNLGPVASRLIELLQKDTIKRNEFDDPVKNESMAV